jgi:hypothetical protein
VIAQSLLSQRFPDSKFEIVVIDIVLTIDKPNPVPLIWGWFVADLKKLIENFRYILWGNAYTGIDYTAFNFIIIICCNNANLVFLSEYFSALDIKLIITIENK